LSEKYKSGTNVTVTATPASGYTFDYWEGDALGTSPIITITMDSDKTLTANFKRQTYTLTITASPSGAGSVSPSSGEYQSGVQVTLTANSASGYTFDHWSGSVSDTASSITITMDSDKNLIANFRAITQTYTLTVNVSPSGAGSVSPSSGQYESGVSVTLTATPANGYTFDYWSGSASGTTSTITVTINSHKSITANFKTTPAQAAIKITAAQLYYEYDQNPVRADQNYKGKILQVSGWVNNIGNDYINLDVGGILASVDCFFDPEQRPEIAQVSEGQHVTVQGQCDGFSSFFLTVYLRHCTLM
jgi:uncharacterized repeat protein (TIGR02543 family)